MRCQTEIIQKTKCEEKKTLTGETLFFNFVWYT